MPTKLRKKTHWYEPCPNGCGNLKDVRAKQCRHCRHANRRIRVHRRPVQANPRPELITPEWAYQFVGVFMSEGTASLLPHNGGRSVAVRLSLSLRADDAALMDDIYEKLGGVVYNSPDGRSNPAVRWTLSGLDDVEFVLRLIRHYSLMPAKKLRDVEVCLEYIEWRKASPYHHTPETRAVAMGFVERLRAIRVFKVPGSQSVSVPTGSHGFP